MSRKYDAIVIGTGQSGPALAGRLNQEGLKTAIIERHLVGGTCVNVGCIPTKTLVGSARIAYQARDAARFGVSIEGDVSVDMQRVKARKDEIAGASNQGVTDWLEGMDNVDLIRGQARFVDAHSVEVNGETLEAEKIFINVGARARVPDWPGIDDVPYFTNSSIMDVDFLFLAFVQTRKALQRRKYLRYALVGITRESVVLLDPLQKRVQFTAPVRLLDRTACRLQLLYLLYTSVRHVDGAIACTQRRIHFVQHPADQFSQNGHFLRLYELTLGGPQFFE